MDEKIKENITVALLYGLMAMFVTFWMTIIS